MLLFINKLFKRKSTEKVTPQEAIQPENKSNIDTGQLLKDSTAFYKEGSIEKAVQKIDEAIAIYKERGEKSNEFPAVKKKCAYLYKNGKRDEAWGIYNEMLLYYGNPNDLTDIITVPQVYDEMRKQMEFEKNHLSAFEFALLSRLMKHRSQLKQNDYYKDNNFEVDMEWNDDNQFIKLANKANVSWEHIKELLIDEYKAVNHNTDFNKLFDKVKNLLAK
ncbi:MAG: hypothetical protein LPK26_04640 [Bacillaceae bacterium]|nr:hypothetical protein [Bacillaceae bacterium]